MNMYFKNTMVRGVHRLYSYSGNDRQKLRGICLLRGEFGGLVLSAIADTNNPCTIDLPQEETVDIAKAILQAAGINAVIVENPRLFINMDGGLIEDVKSNIPGIDVNVFDSDMEYLDWNDPNNPNETEEEFGRRFDLAVARFEEHKEKAAEGLEDHEFNVVAADNLPIVVLQNHPEEK